MWWAPANLQRERELDCGDRILGLGGGSGPISLLEIAPAGNVLRLETDMDQEELVASLSSNHTSQLWYAGQIGLFQLLEVDLVIDIDGLFSAISSQLLDELTPHTSPPEVSGHPVPAAVADHPHNNGSMAFLSCYWKCHRTESPGRHMCPDLSAFVPANCVRGSLPSAC